MEPIYLYDPNTFARTDGNGRQRPQISVRKMGFIQITKPAEKLLGISRTREQWLQIGEHAHGQRLHCRIIDAPHGRQLIKGWPVRYANERSHSYVRSIGLVDRIYQLNFCERSTFGIRLVLEPGIEPGWFMLRMIGRITPRNTYRSKEGKLVTT